MKKARPYRMGARAVASADTERRILAAMQAAFADRPYDRITLEQVATAAGVTLQTVLRRFGAKDQLLVAAAADGAERIAAQRGAAPTGDTAGAVRNLFDHYETWGPISLRLLEQEQRLEAIGAITRAGRQTHAAWVARVFAWALGARRGGPRGILHGQLVALTDVYVWKILRRDRGLTRAASERAVTAMIEALVGTPGGK